MAGTGRAPLTDEEKDRIVHLVQVEGMTQKEVMAVMHVSGPTIRKVLNENEGAIDGNRPVTISDLVKLQRKYYAKIDRLIDKMDMAEPREQYSIATAIGILTDKITALRKLMQGETDDDLPQDGDVEALVGRLTDNLDVATSLSRRIERRKKAVAAAEESPFSGGSPEIEA